MFVNKILKLYLCRSSIFLIKFILSILQFFFLLLVSGNLFRLTLLIYLREKNVRTFILYHLNMSYEC